MNSSFSDERERKLSVVRLIMNLVNQQMATSKWREERDAQQMEASQRRKESVIALLEQMCAASEQL